jgi:hypothetical protein
LRLGRLCVGIAAKQNVYAHRSVMIRVSGLRSTFEFLEIAENDRVHRLGFADMGRAESRRGQAFGVLTVLRCPWNSPANRATDESRSLSFKASRRFALHGAYSTLATLLKRVSPCGDASASHVPAKRPDLPLASGRKPCLRTRRHDLRLGSRKGFGGCGLDKPFAEVGGT